MNETKLKPDTLSSLFSSHVWDLSPRKLGFMSKTLFQSSPLQSRRATSPEPEPEPLHSLPFRNSKRREERAANEQFASLLILYICHPELLPSLIRPPGLTASLLHLSLHCKLSIWNEWTLPSPLMRLNRKARLNKNDHCTPEQEQRKKGDKTKTPDPPSPTDGTRNRYDMPFTTKPDEF